MAQATKIEVSKDLITRTTEIDDKKALSTGDFWILGTEESTPSLKKIIEGSLLVSSEQGDFLLVNDSVSKEHCRFSVKDEVVTLEDLGSLNGTYVQGQKLEPHKKVILEAGDRILVGTQLLVLWREERRLVEESIENSDRTADIDIPLTLEEPVAAASIEEAEERGEDADFALEEEKEEENIGLVLEEEQEEEEIQVQTQDEVVPESMTTLLVGAKEKLAQAMAAEEKGEAAPAEAKLEIVDKNGANSTRIVKLKKNLAKKIEKEKSKSHKEQAVGEIIGIMPRLLSLLLDLLFVYLVWQFLKDQELITPLVDILKDIFNQQTQDKVLELIKQYSLGDYLPGDFEGQWPSYFQQFVSVVPMLGLFAFLRLVSVILFGCSFSLILCGGGVSGNFVVNRLGGILREVLGCITLPFLVFDLPVLFKRRSVKELITFTGLKEISSKRMIFLGMPLFFILLIVAWFSPLLFSLVQAPESFSVKNIKPHLEKIEIDKAQDKVFSAPFFNLTLSWQENKGFEFLPDFDFAMVDGKKLAIPQLVIVQNNGMAARLSRINKIENANIFASCVSLLECLNSIAAFSLSEIPIPMDDPQEILKWRDWGTVRSFLFETFGQISTLLYFKVGNVDVVGAMNENELRFIPVRGNELYLYSYKAEGKVQTEELAQHLASALQRAYWKTSASVGEQNLLSLFEEFLGKAREDQILPVMQHYLPYWGKVILGQSQELLGKELLKVLENYRQIATWRRSLAKDDEQKVFAWEKLILEHKKALTDKNRSFYGVTENGGEAPLQEVQNGKF